jgi:periplasmic mercuric ion binding protein
MKYISIFLLLFTFAKISIAGQTDTLKVKTQVYCDHCVECESCWPKMEKELTFTSGIKKSTFDPKSMVITVIYNPKRINPEKIRKTISKIGFDADDVKADPKAQGKLDGCCKKQ